MRDDEQDSAETTDRESGTKSLLAEAAEHPGATAALVVCIVGGAALAGLYMPESTSLPRRVTGGAVMGGMSWLLVMVGRLLGG